MYVIMQEAVRIDTIPGMDIEIDNEFMQYLKRSIITGMNVPANYIDESSQVDFARNLTMSNNPFVRSIINDQAEFGEFFSKVTQELYRNEFASDKKRKKRNVKTGTNKGKKINNISNISIEDINVRFPSPTYLVLGNTNENIQNSSTIIDFIAGYFYPDDPTGQQMSLERETQKNNFKKQLAKEIFLPTMDWNMYEKIYKNVLQEFNKEALDTNINFAQEAKPKNELDDIEDNDFSD
jgi:hypothetical protein